MKPIIQSFVSTCWFITLLLGLYLPTSKVVAAEPTGVPPVQIQFLGEEESVTWSGMEQIEYAPDGNLSYLVDDNRRIQLYIQGMPIGAGYLEGTYGFTGTAISRLKPIQATNGAPVPALRADRSGGFDSHYIGVSGVYRSHNGNDLLLTYQGENHDCGQNAPKVGMGIARSRDNGKTWQKEGQILSSPTSCSNRRFEGTGNASTLVSHDGDYIYIYYTDWQAGQPDEITMARAEIGSDGLPGSWYKYYNGEFSQPGLGGASSPVVKAPTSAATFASAPHVSYNSSIDKYLMLFMGHDGFYATVSDDGINWESAFRFWGAMAITKSKLHQTTPWYFYPTFITEGNSSDDQTGVTGYLYYATGFYGTPHKLMRRPMAIYLNSIQGVVATDNHQATSTMIATLYRHNPQSNTWAAKQSVAINNQNSYRFYNIPNGKYRVAIFDTSGTYVTHFYDYTMSDSAMASESSEQITPNAVSEISVKVLSQRRTPLVSAYSPTGSRSVAAKGVVYIRMPGSQRSDVTYTTQATCSAGQVSQVFLTFHDTIYPMQLVDGQQYQATIPASAIASPPADQMVTRTIVCDQTPFNQLVSVIAIGGRIGSVYDATSHQPIANATVVLFQMPGWRADTDGETLQCRTLQTRPNSNWSGGIPQPDRGAPVELELMNSTLPMNPSVNPILTSGNGHYGWDIREGCWYVMVRAQGYTPTVSPIAGLAPDVHDLDVYLEPMAMTYSYLPIIDR